MPNPILPGTPFGSTGRNRSFAWSHILHRAVWNLTWLAFAAWTPPQAHRWRRLLLNLFGARIAPGARVYGSARIWYPPNLTMGRGAVLGWRSLCYCMGPIVIGDYAVVSQFSHLVSGTHDADDPNFQLYTKPIRIGAHAWIAARAFVGPGVEVADGAVLGACGVAFSNLEAWTIYAGNPAKVVRARTNFCQLPTSGLPAPEGRSEKND
jgi:putative colanic acid biosynthesis acetyltransferase WcaF